MTHVVRTRPDGRARISMATRVDGAGGVRFFRKSMVPAAARTMGVAVRATAERRHSQ